MDVEVFRNLYYQSINSKEGLFSFKKLSDELSLLTPESKRKTKLVYSDSVKKIVIDSKEAIIRNLSINPVIKKIDFFSVNILSDLMKFLDFKTDSERSLAQSLFMLHASKADFSKETDPKSIYEDIFMNFLSIDTHVDKSKYAEFYSIFESLVNNEHLIESINKSIDNIVEIKSSYDFSNLKLILFKSKLSPVRGFSGNDRIYINTRPFYNFLDIKFFSEDIKKLALKLEFTRLFLHEASHVLLRFRIGNLNISSPFLKENEKFFLIKKNVDEAGIETEKRIFKEVINWERSITNNYNYDYCKQYLAKILDNKYDEFDIQKAGVKIFKEQDIPKMAFSIRFYGHVRFF